MKISSLIQSIKSKLVSPPGACPGGVYKTYKTYKNKVSKHLMLISCKGVKNMQLRHCEIMQYDEYLKCDIQRVIKEHTTIKEWAYIHHDKDDTGAHYHIYLNFGKSSCDTEMVAKWFGIEPQYVNRVKGRKADMLLYLIHGNDTQKDKHQYDPSEVVSNFDYGNAIVTEKIVGDFEHYSYAQMLEYVNTLPVGEKPAAFTRLEKLWKIQCQAMTLRTDRKIEVVFVCGRAGTGKTFYAKKMLKQLNYDFCISSASNDVFQDYLGQKAIILDDLRDDAFELADLLKILDNNTSSSVRSRFVNKVFNGEMIVITTPKPLWYWYAKHKCDYTEPLGQLYRRITCYIDVTTDEIKIYDKIDENGKPYGAFRMFKNDIPRIVANDSKKTDFGDLFGKICEEKLIFEQMALSDVNANNGGAE